MLLLAMGCLLGWADDFAEYKFRATTKAAECLCLKRDFDETNDVKVAPHTTLVGVCQIDKQTVECVPDNAIGEVITCPTGCVELKELPAVTEARIAEETKKAQDRFKSTYLEGVPKAVKDSLNKAYPKWQPAVFRAPTRFPKFSLAISRPAKVYLEGPVKLKGETKTVSVLVFQNGGDKKQNINSWAFFDTVSGKLLKEAPLPFALVESSYISEIELKDGVITGEARGPSDTGPCCGPHDLSKFLAN